MADTKKRAYTKIYKKNKKRNISKKNKILYVRRVWSANAETALSRYIVWIGFLNDIDIITNNWKMSDWNEDRIRESIKPVVYDSCAYVAEYVIKKINDRNDEEYAPMGREKPFRIQSNGIGKRFALEEKDRIVSNKLTSRGVPKTVPRYYLKVHGMKACDIISENDRLNREADANYKILGIHNTNYELYGESMVLYWRSLHYYKKRQKDKQRNLNLTSRLKIMDERKIL